MTTAQTQIFLKGYQVMTSIGVHPHEHAAKQQIKVDIELDLGAIPAPKNDRLIETLNYEWLAELIERQCAIGHVQLIETLIWQIADQCLVEPKVQRVRIRIEKSAAITKADAAGVELVLNRANI